MVVWLYPFAQSHGINGSCWLRGSKVSADLIEKRENVCFEGGGEKKKEKKTHYFGEREVVNAT